MGGQEGEGMSEAYTDAKYWLQCIREGMKYMDGEELSTIIAMLTYLREEMIEEAE